MIKEAVVNGNSHELRSDESTIDVGSWLVQNLVLAICLMKVSSQCLCFVILFIFFFFLRLCAHRTSE